MDQRRSNVDSRPNDERFVPGYIMVHTRTLLNAALGALIIVFFWHIPGSPLLGGSVAGFLQGGTPNEGMKAGALAGTFVPFVAILFAGVVFALTGRSVFGRWPFGVTGMLLVMGLGVLYTVGLGAVGGYIGPTFVSESFE